MKRELVLLGLGLMVASVACGDDSPTGGSGGSGASTPSGGGGASSGGGGQGQGGLATGGGGQAQGGAGQGGGGAGQGGAGQGGGGGGCPHITDDATHIGDDCTGGGPCPTGYQCWGISGVVFQEVCAIICAESCECPDGTTCQEFSDKAQSWMECSP